MIKLSDLLRRSKMCRGKSKGMDKCAEVAQPGRALG